MASEQEVLCQLTVTRAKRGWPFLQLLGQQLCGPRSFHLRLVVLLECREKVLYASVRHATLMIGHR